jgi:DNA-binding MarR family transcriptional regulator
MAKVAAPAAAEQAWRMMLELFFSQRGKMMGVAQDIGLAPQQAMALTRLQPGEPMKLSDLAQALHCDNSNVTGIADRLEAAGIAERRAHPSDRRVKTLRLTALGEVVRTNYLERIGTAPDALRALADDDIATLVAILQRATAGGS